MKEVLILIVVIIGSLSFVLIEKTNENADDSKPAYAKDVIAAVGDKAPSFNQKNINGKEYSFDNITDANGQKPKGYIIVFTCNTCPVSKANESRLIALHKKYSKEGYPIVAIQPNDPEKKRGESFDAMKRYAADKKFPFIYLMDEGQKVYPQYGATKTPEVYLVDDQQIIRYHGAIDDSARDPSDVDEKFLEMAIESLQKGEDPKPQETRAIGCGIR